MTARIYVVSLRKNRDSMPLVVVMPGRCPKCGGRLMKRTGVSKKTNKQYNYYCCEHRNAKDEAAKCDFMTWDVPVKDDCPVCGQTMVIGAGGGHSKKEAEQSAARSALEKLQKA